MGRAFRFVVFLIAGLALLTWAALVGVNATTRDWFEKDISLRAQLVVTGSRRALVTQWTQGNANELRTLLTDIAHDERIMGAGACGLDGRLLAATSDFPA
jgi:trehalose 6-phosphate synthase